jgi:hypothetical protein
MRKASRDNKEGSRLLGLHTCSHTSATGECTRNRKTDHKPAQAHDIICQTALASGLVSAAAQEVARPPQTAPGSIWQSPNARGATWAVPDPYVTSGRVIVGEAMLQRANRARVDKTFSFITSNRGLMGLAEGLTPMMIHA